MKGQLMMEIASVLGEEKKILKLLDEWYQNHPIMAEEPYLELRTVVAEACLNAIEHGNFSNPSLPVEVELNWSQKAVVVVVKDCGPGFDRPEASEEDRGWGLRFIQAFMDEIKFYRETVTKKRFCLEMTKRLTGGGLNE